ncbi:hypothetical protein ACFLS9_05730, partial [Bacteroidota bacterium]
MKKLHYFLIFLISFKLLGQSDNCYIQRVIVNLTDDPAHSIAVTWQSEIKLSSPKLQITISSSSPIKKMDQVKEFSAELDSMDISPR